MHKVQIVPSDQERTAWVCALLRKERKDARTSRVIVFVRSEEAALTLHRRLKQSFTSAVNAGPHAADGLARFREGQRLVLVTPDARVPASALLAHGAVGISWDPPSSLAAHRARMRAAAGAATTVSHQLLVRSHIGRLDPDYARMLVLSLKLANDPVPAGLEEAAQPPARPAKRARTTSESLVFFHGTSDEKAQKILAQGFNKSPVGCLGAGVYVARDDKATGFACRCWRHGGSAGATLQVRITFSNAKFVPYDDGAWQAEGYDACRADRTSRSTKMEWCLKNPNQVEVLDVVPVQCGQCE